MLATAPSASLSTDAAPAFTRFHGEAARVYVARCRAAHDRRSPLMLLTEIMGRAQALQVLPLMLDAEALNGDIDVAHLFSRKPRRTRSVDGDCT